MTLLITVAWFSVEVFPFPCIIPSLQTFQRKVHTDANRRAVCWMDEWFGLSMDDVFRMERETFEKLNKVSGWQQCMTRRQEGEVWGRRVQ